jgi:glyoxylase-like metal-dependent hydrolase (beta-lactamase superfamily II)
MKSFLSTLFAVALLAASPRAVAQVETAPLSARWSEGARDCKARPEAPLEIRAYDATTFVLRENLCATFEAPFMYLLIGKTRALLIDTGDVADPALMPLAKTVMGLLPQAGAARLPLLVVHTHRHSDHRAGDAQFQNLPGVQVVGYDLVSIQRFYHFTDWPNGLAQIDLGGRTVDVFPTPGHNATHVAFFDRNSALLFSGDFLLPGRLLIDDAKADLASARRAAAFVQTRPVSAVLGGHIEQDTAGNAFDWGSRYHPGEQPLPMTKADVLALPAAVSHFNGFYGQWGRFIMVDSERLLIVTAAIVIVALVGLGLGLILFFRRRRARSWRRFARP